MATTTLRPEAPRYRYEGDQFGRPVPVEARTGRPAPVAGEAVDAITMPPAFGALVQAELEIMMLAGPVVAGPGEGPWTFLTQLASTRSPAVPADLLALGVRLIPTGTRVTLPTTSGRPDLRSWVTPPVSNRPPAIWSAVIGTARRVAARRLAEHGGLFKTPTQRGWAAGRGRSPAHQRDNNVAVARQPQTANLARRAGPPERSALPTTQRDHALPSP